MKLAAALLVPVLGLGCSAGGGNNAGHGNGNGGGQGDGSTASPDGSTQSNDSSAPAQDATMPAPGQDAGGLPPGLDGGSPPPGSDAGPTPGQDGGGPSSGLDSDIQSMVSQVSATNISNSIAKLSSFTTRNTCSDDTAGANTIGDARDWIKAQLSADSGLTVQLDSFTYAGCTGGSVTRENVIAWKLGTHPGRLIVVGGHYDSRTLNVTDPTSAAPGANDSGSQTALVLELARIMASHTFDATLVFAAFAGEEQSLVGSAGLATGYGKYFATGAAIEAMFNSDIVGGDTSVNDAGTLQQFRLYSPGTPREITTPIGTTDDTSPSRGMMRLISTWGGAYVPSMTMVPMLREDRPGRGGDHESFIDQSIPGVRFIETVESPEAGTVGSHQHSPNDLMMYVTPAYTARVAQVVLSSIASLARAPSPPQSLSATGNATGPVMLSWAAPASGSAVDHYALAARAVTENFYHARVVVPTTATQTSVTPAGLGVTGASAFFVSVAGVDAQGHESLFAYPEYRCDATSCVVQAGSTNVTTKN